VLAVLITFAENACEFPSKTEAVVGVTVTTMDGDGGGGGGFVPVPVLPPPQPARNAPAEMAARNRKTAQAVESRFLRRPIQFTFSAFCVRGRMHVGMQAKGQRKR